jgi:hypothetical protein
MGKLLGHPVKASDGKMYPPRSKAERQTSQQARNLKKEKQRQRKQVWLLRDALNFLSSIKDSPETLQLYLGETDREEVATHLDQAVGWLFRFAKEWHSHESINKECPTGQNSRRYL